MSLEGQQLGRYRLLQLLGSGGMGEVYLAEDQGINRQVAIKVIRSDVALRPGSDEAIEAVRLFQREMKTVARLNHPRILPLFDYGEAVINGVLLPYMVMPFGRDGSLATWMKQRGNAPLGPSDVAYFVQQAADALQYAHEQQIIHRDVKPSNFLIRLNRDSPQRPDILLADFGLARLNTASTSITQTIAGSPPYMSPEQWRGRPVPSTDQYMLAAMAYELLTGRPPFQGTMEQLMYQHLQEQPEPPSRFNPQIPPGLDAVVLRALAKQPEYRFPTISAFARAFQEALQMQGAQPLSQPTGHDPYATVDTGNMGGAPASSSPPGFSIGQPGAYPGPGSAGPSPGQLSSYATRSEPVSEGRAGRGLNISLGTTRKGLTCSLSLLLTLLVLVGGVTFFQVMNRPAGLSSSPGTSGSTSSGTTPGAGGTATAAAQATPIANATATAIALQSLYKQATSGTPVLDDPLRDNSKGYQWDVASGQGGVCQFANGGYDVSMSQPGMFYRCTARSTSFSNFAYQVQATLVKGDQCGIIFRFDNIQTTFYSFLISREGTYMLNTDNKQGFVSQLGSGSSSAIKPGPNQSNLIAVIARGADIYLYVNGQYLAAVHDSTYRVGAIGVIAEDDGQATEALFSNAKVWTL